MSRTPSFIDLCKRASEGTTNRVRLVESRFLTSTIPLPPLDEQRRIVARIETLAAKIQEARALRRQAETRAQALLASTWRELFHTAEERGWSSLSVEDSCEAIIDYRGRTPPLAADGIPHLTSMNIKNGRIEWDTTRFVTPDTYRAYMTRGIPRVGDVIFTMEAPLGEAAVVTDERVFSLAQRTLLLRGARGIMDGQFLARVLTSPQVRTAIYARATGTTVKGIASKRLKQILLPVPSPAEQHNIGAHLDDLETKVNAVKLLQADTAAELNALLPSVLDRAFKGEL